MSEKLTWYNKIAAVNAIGKNNGLSKFSLLSHRILRFENSVEFHI